MGRIGAEGGLRGEGERAAVEVGEFEVRAAREDGFGDVGLGDADAQVVVEGPEPGVKRSCTVGVRATGSSGGSEPPLPSSGPPGATQAAVTV